MLESFGEVQLVLDSHPVHSALVIEREQSLSAAPVALNRACLEHANVVAPVFELRDREPADTARNRAKRSLKLHPRPCRYQTHGFRKRVRLRQECVFVEDRIVAPNFHAVGNDHEPANIVHELLSKDFAVAAKKPQLELLGLAARRLPARHVHHNVRLHLRLRDGGFDSKVRIFNLR